MQNSWNFVALLQVLDLELKYYIEILLGKKIKNVMSVSSLKTHKLPQGTTKFKLTWNSQWSLNIDYDVVAVYQVFKEFCNIELAEILFWK